MQVFLLWQNIVGQNGFFPSPFITFLIMIRTQLLLGPGIGQARVKKIKAGIV